MKLLITFIEMMFSMGMFINAGLFIPQILKLVKTKDAADLSLMTFLGFNFIQLFMALHGLLNNDMLLLAGALVSLLTCGTVSILIMKYRFLANNQAYSRLH